MILPSKSVKPIDSLFCISAYLVKILSFHETYDIETLYEKLQEIYPKKISIETYLLCINYLFIIRKLEVEKDETIKIIF